VRLNALNMHSRFSLDGKWTVFVSVRAWLNDEPLLSNGNQQTGGYPSPNFSVYLGLAW
jgi:hypothetical protein